MSELHFTNLLIVVAIALLAPLLLGFFPRIRLPAIVLEMPFDLVRHDLLMDLDAVSRERATAIVDDLFLPLLGHRGET